MCRPVYFVRAIYYNRMYYTAYMLTLNQSTLFYTAHNNIKVPSYNAYSVMFRIVHVIVNYIVYIFAIQ